MVIIVGSCVSVGRVLHDNAHHSVDGAALHSVGPSGRTLRVRHAVTAGFAELGQILLAQNS